MAISILKARRARTADTKTVTVEFGGESMSVEFRLSAITPTTLAALQADDGDKLASTVDFLCEVLSKWEVVDEDGATLDIDPVVLSVLPVDFLTAIASAITADVQVPKASMTGSFAS
jgi:hypothetical protein